MAKYKPSVNDEIYFIKDEKKHSGTITWIADSGFVVVSPHTLPIKDTKGDLMDCSLVVEAREIVGPKT